MQSLSTGIMGAGRMAQGFDTPGSEKILSLAHAVQTSDRFALGGFYDVDQARAKLAEKKWNCPPSPRDRMQWLDAGWDAVFIATPDACHEADFEAVLARKPKALLVEKPLTTDGAAGERLLARARELRVPVIVDFPRRWHSGIRRVTQLLESGEWGGVRQVHAICSGGVLHNGIHIFDLVAAWCPEIQGVDLVAQRDGLTWLSLHTESGAIDFIVAEAAQSGTYNWQLDVQCERGRIELSSVPEKLVLHRQAAHPNYPEVLTLVPMSEWPMEDEPLLPRMLDQLAALVDDPAAAVAHVAAEEARQRFFTKIAFFFQD